MRTTTTNNLRNVYAKATSLSVLTWHRSLHNYFFCLKKTWKLREYGIWESSAMKIAHLRKIDLLQAFL